MPDLRAAIEQAALARTAEGKCHGHQGRVGNGRLRHFEQALQRRRARIARCRSFDELHDLIWEHRTRGIGDLTVYDTSTRIGAFLGLAPEKVYLHAGARDGARALGLRETDGCVLREDLPRELRGMDAGRVEDFLCQYKGALRGVGDGNGACGPGHARPGRQACHPGLAR